MDGVAGAGVVEVDGEQLGAEHIEAGAVGGHRREQAGLSGRGGDAWWHGGASGAEVGHGHRDGFDQLGGVEQFLTRRLDR